MMHRILGLTGCLALCACALDVQGAAEQVSGTVEMPLSARSDDLKLTLRVSSAPEAGLVIEGRTNRALEGAKAFVPDDEVGSTTLGEKGFATTLPLSELTGRLLGSPLLFSVRTRAGDTHFARASFALRLPSSCKTTRLSFERPLRNVLVDGVPAVRFSGRTTLASVKASARVGSAGIEGEAPVWSGRREQDRFWIDIPVDVASTAALTRTPVHFTLESGRTVLRKSCTPEVMLTALEMTREDPYDVWPTPTCSEELSECLARAEDLGDTSACGDPYTVRACGPRALPDFCGESSADKLANTVRGTWWMSETDAPFEPVTFAADGGESLADVLRRELQLGDDALVETRSLDEVLAWPGQDRSEDAAEDRLRAAHYRTLYRQMDAWLDEVQVVRVGEVEIDVYFAGRDACGNVVALKTLAVET